MAKVRLTLDTRTLSVTLRKKTLNCHKVLSSRSMERIIMIKCMSRPNLKSKRLQMALKS